MCVRTHTILPRSPPWLRQFLPAYKATRVIAEILIESLPQSILQGFIYVCVVKHSEAGTASPPELRMLPEVALMPTSILISTMASLKTWMELVQAAREAGLSVVDKAVQLWNVGAGMPLDALKKDAIVEGRATHDAQTPVHPALRARLKRWHRARYRSSGSAPTGSTPRRSRRCSTRSRRTARSSTSTSA